MLKITIPSREFYDEAKEEFISTKETSLALEHSLVSISKWEAIYEKPFLDSTGEYEKSADEILKYIECMTITQNVDPLVYRNIPMDVMEQIKTYISASKSATTFSKTEGRAPSREIVTSELIYYWMTSYQIPFECEKWPIQRLLNLIRICSIKNAPKKTMSQRELMSRNSALNAARKARMNSNG